MKEIIDFRNAAKIINVRSWGCHGEQSDSTKKIVNFLDETIFTELDLFHLYSDKFIEFYIQNQDFERSVEFWFAVYIADDLAKSKAKMNFDNCFFYINEKQGSSSSVRRRYAWNLYRSLNTEQRMFLIKILFINEELSDPQKTSTLKSIPIEIVQAILQKEEVNEFNGVYSMQMIKEITLIIHTTK